MNLQQSLREHILNQYLKGHEPEGSSNDYNLIENEILDSLAMISLVTYLEKTYQIEFGDHDFVPEHFSSVTTLAEFVQQRCAG